jgi:hypothetical protein
MIINTVEKIYETIPTVEHNGYRVTYVNSNKVKLVPLDTANTDYQAIQDSEMSIIKPNNNTISAITALPAALTIVREGCKEVSWQ